MNEQTVQYTAQFFVGSPESYTAVTAFLDTLRELEIQATVDLFERVAYASVTITAQEPSMVAGVLQQAVWSGLTKGYNVMDIAPDPHVERAKPSWVPYPGPKERK